MSTTVNYGCDLGTTNSAIARATAKGVEVIPVKRQQYIPSAVGVDKRGDVKVGVDAISPLIDFQRWFKRNMGTQATVEMGGKSWTPEELSAEVLKALRAAVKLKTNEDLEDLVITVPAMFSQPQCASTQAAARLAGLNAVVLLQEPIAAATAYLSEDPIDGNYLVFDLGGGTLDASIIRLKGGEMNVVGHGGDNYLGGADFDRAVFDWVLDQVDRKGGDTSKFDGGAWRHQLLQACEDARIALSDQVESVVYLDDFDLPISKITIARDQLEDLVEGFVTKSIQIAQDRLRDARLSPRDVRAILLVGGPTQMPYIRRRLQDELGIGLNLDQDPMTVVAKGAAIHASTLLLEQGQRQPRNTSSAAEMGLHYDPVSPDDYCTVAGKVVQPPGFQGEVRISGARGDWESGWKRLTNAAFSMEVTLRGQQLAEFRIEVRDETGRVIPVNPDSFSIRSGVRAAQPVVPYTLGVVLEGGKVEPIIGAGQPLPASGSTDRPKLAKSLIAGSPDEVSIYFVEGASSFASENVQVGFLKIRGTDIKRTLKENEKVEIRMRMDESRLLKARVYIPLLDVDFPVEMQSTIDAPNEEDLAAALRETKIALAEVEDHVEEEEQDLIMRAESQLEQLEASLERVHKGETGEAERIHKQLSDAKARIRPLRDKYALKSLHFQVVALIGEASDLCERFSDRLGLAKLQDLKEDADKALRLQQEKTLDSIRERARDVFWEHYGKTEECWEYQVQLLHEHSYLASDPLAYHELTRKAEAALRARDFDGVRLHYLQACELLPAKEKLRDRFHDAALR